MENYVVNSKPIDVHIRKVETGEVRICRTVGYWDEDGFFHDRNWREGNYSCDCNRYSFFEGGDYDDVNCSEGLYLIDKITATDQPDEILYAELEDEHGN